MACYAVGVARRLTALAIASSAWGLAIACGARTGLLAPEVDAQPVDAAIELPPLDVFTDVPIVTNCPDAGATLVYVLTEQNELFSFYPPTLVFTRIGTLACPSGSSPFSMAVSRGGIAYSVFEDGHLFQVDTANAACQPTSFVPGQQGFLTFGMSYAGDSDGGDTLYVAEGDYQTNSKGLATIDTTSFKLTFVGPFSPSLPNCELTGTNDGRLFAFCVPIHGNGSSIEEIDPATAQVIAGNSLTIGGSGDSFAYAFWGGDFWIFTAPGQNAMTTVTRYDPVTLSETTATTLAATVVGAGVSTCAPE